MVQRVLIFLAAAVITSVFFINFCATIFQCGCQSLWTGADAHCNVHSVGQHRCPWCVYGAATSYIPYVAMLIAQAAISFWPRPMPATRRMFGAVLAFPLSGTILAVLYGLATGYWRR